VVTDARSARPVSPATSVQSWERYREDAREAILAKLASGPGGKGSPVDVSSGRTPPASQPAGLVRATVLQANSESEALVDIGGKSYLINTRQALAEGANVILRLLDSREFAQGGPATARVRGGAPSGDPAAAGAGGAAGDMAGAPDIDPVTGIRRVGIAPVTLPALAELKTASSEVNVQLSGSARLLSALASAPDSPQRLVPLAPLALDRRTDTTASAQKIQHAVEHSGLFYESHLQEWQEGRRSLDALRAEPQAALSPGLPAKPDAAGKTTDMTPVPSTPEQSAAKGLQAALGAIPADVRPIVQDQIALLETGRMGLLGSWEGRPFSLEIEPDDNGPRSDDIPLSWRVKIQIDAPNLGKLELDVALAGTQANVTVRPDGKTTKGQALRDLQAALTSTSAELQTSLDARGLQMTGLNVAPVGRSTVDRS
jgi:hypothetical protein